MKVRVYVVRRSGLGWVVVARVLCFWRKQFEHTHTRTQKETRVRNKNRKNGRKKSRKLVVKNTSRACFVLCLCVLICFACFVSHTDCVQNQRVCVCGLRWLLTLNSNVLENTSHVTKQIDGVPILLGKDDESKCAHRSIQWVLLHEKRGNSTDRGLRVSLPELVRLNMGSQVSHFFVDQRRFNDIERELQLCERSELFDGCLVRAGTVFGASAGVLMAAFHSVRHCKLHLSTSADGCNAAKRRTPLESRSERTLSQRLGAGKDSPFGLFLRGASH